MPITLNDNIFINIEDTYNFLCQNNIIIQTISCSKCVNSNMVLKIYKHLQRKTIIYRCLNKLCQRRTSIFNTKIEINKYFQLVYLIMTEANYKQLFFWLGYSDATIAAVKNKHIECYKIYLTQRPILLGGNSVIIECDETVISRRGVIRNPSALDDSVQDTVWIFGAIDSTNNKNFLLKRIENRTISALTNALAGNVQPGSILHTDGYASYPRVAANLNLAHRIVNHNAGFVTIDGIHTNNIEGFWAHLKSSMRKENGVKRVNIDNWLVSYTFKRRYILNATRIELKVLYIEILRILLRRENI